jgi:hypothetical protein
VGRSYAAGSGVVLIALVLCMVVTGCATPGSAVKPATYVDPAVSTSAPTPSAGATVSASATKTVVPDSVDALQKRNANILGTMVQMSLSTDVNWNTEPSGDIWPKGKPVKLYVHISKLATSSPSLTYDAMQVFTGGAAQRSAARDKQKLPQSGVYERNAFNYSQELNVNPKAGVVLQNPSEKDALYGTENYRRITVTTFKDFAQQFTTGDRSGELQWAGYWIYFDGDGVQCIIQQAK